MSAPQMTTAEALRTALASTIACSAPELQDAVGRIVVATSAECPDSGSDVRSLSDPHTRTTVLLADRIPSGQEAAAVAREIERHHGRQAAYVVIGDRAEELLGSEGIVQSNQSGYVIRLIGESETDLDGSAGEFWSNEDGWGSLEGATLFSAGERQNFHLPIFQERESEWVSIERARDLVAGRQFLNFDHPVELASDEGAPTFTDPNEFLLSEYSKYAVGVSEGDPMEFDDWLAGSDLPEIVEARQRANLQGNVSVPIEQPQQPVSAIASRIAEALPANGGYEKGYKDALESLVLALSPKLAGSLDDAIETALDAYSNNVDHPSAVRGGEQANPTMREALQTALSVFDRLAEGEDFNALIEETGATNKVVTAINASANQLVPDLSGVDAYALQCELERRGLLVQLWSPGDFEFIGNEDDDAADLSDAALEQIQQQAFEQCRRSLDEITTQRGNEHLGDWWTMNKEPILAQFKTTDETPSPGM